MLSSPALALSKLKLSHYKSETQNILHIIISWVASILPHPGGSISNRSTFSFFRCGTSINLKLNDISGRQGRRFCKAGSKRQIAGSRQETMLALLDRHSPGLCKRGQRAPRSKQTSKSPPPDHRQLATNNNHNRQQKTQTAAASKPAQQHQTATAKAKHANVPAGRSKMGRENSESVF